MGRNSHGTKQKKTLSLVIVICLYILPIIHTYIYIYILPMLKKDFNYFLLVD